jgi:hypothetical protein
LGHLFEQPMRVDPDADVPDHRFDRVKIGARKLFAACLSAQQHETCYFTAHDHRQHQLDILTKECLAMAPDETDRALSG